MRVSLSSKVSIVGKVGGKYIHFYFWHIKAHLLAVYGKIPVNCQLPKSTDEEMAYWSLPPVPWITPGHGKKHTIHTSESANKMTIDTY